MSRSGATDRKTESFISDCHPMRVVSAWTLTWAFLHCEVLTELAALPDQVQMKKHLRITLRNTSAGTLKAQVKISRSRDSLP